MISQPYTLILGLGKTGFSCAQYLASQNISFAVADSRKEPPYASAFKSVFPSAPLVLGELPKNWLENADEIIISPGLSLNILSKELRNKKNIIGDIEVFARAIKKPILGITGSNGKSTVTALVGEMLKEANKKTIVCGNIGEPVLNFVAKEKETDCFVLELSSFQLETTHSLNLFSSVILNVSEDHMDRYATAKEYLEAKKRIYRNCRHPVVNLDEPFLWQDIKFNCKPITFSIKKTDADFFILEKQNSTYLCHQGKPIISTDQLKLNAPHHWQNALAALALGSTLDVPLESMVGTLQNFAGLPHRCQWVRSLNGIGWYNDSKGTNVGATLTAIASLGEKTEGKIILIAGGMGKGADFSLLRDSVKKYVSHVILLGQDAQILEGALKDHATIHQVTQLSEAVMLALKYARSKDNVLLSPACASLDMFQNYEHRGQVFMDLVNGL